MRYYSYVAGSQLTNSASMFGTLSPASLSLHLGVLTSNVSSICETRLSKPSSEWLASEDHEFESRSRQYDEEKPVSFGRPLGAGAFATFLLLESVR